MADAPIVAIFRLQMFKRSEPFITTQAGAMTRFSPFYLGRAVHGPPPPAARSTAVGNAVSPGVLWNAVTRDPRLFLSGLGEVRPALIHAHFGPDAAYALPLARKLGVPLVTTFHGFDVTVSDRASLTSCSPYLTNYVLFRRRLAALGDLFLCVSHHILQKALALGFPPARTRLHYIGIDTTCAALADCGGATILHVARLVEKKGTADLITAFATARQENPAAQLVIIGDGPLRAPLQSLAIRLGVAGAVHFMGAQPNSVVLEQMRRAAIFVLPSVTAGSGDTEGLPITILEAASLGLPVIGTFHGGIPEVVQDGRTGLLVPERDPLALAAALHRLLGDEAERRRLGAAAAAHVAAHFSLRRQTARLEDEYENLLA